MKLLSTLIGTLFFSFILSCQREVSEDSPNPQPTDNDSILLTRFVELDTTLPAGSDTLTKYLYTYDRQRISKAVSMYYSTPGSPADDIETEEFFYNGTDTLPFKSVYTINDPSYTYKDTTFYFYTNGVMNRDSNVLRSTIIPLTALSTRRYIPSGNNTILHAKEYYTSLTVPDVQWTGTIVKTYSNNSISDQVDTTSFPIMYTEWPHLAMTFDNHVNPFYRTRAAYPVMRGSYVQRSNPTGLTKWTDATGSTVHEQYSYSYVYRADGYPVIVRRTDVFNPANIIKGLYFYAD